MIRPRGFILVEFLVAIILFSLAGAGIYNGLMQGIRAEKWIRQSFKTYDPIRIVFLRLDEDLRNTVRLKDYPFVGKKEEIRFPARLENVNQVVLIRYFLRNGALVRTESELKPELKKGNEKEKVLIANVKSLVFQYPYIDTEEKRLFENFWLDDPYQGIPRGVQMNIKFEGVDLSKMVSIPQGKLGHIEHE